MVQISPKCRKRPWRYHGTQCHAIMALAMTACASYTQLPPKAQAVIGLRHVGRSVELRSSCYYGPLYDENEKWLLSPYPFAVTSHLVDWDDQPLHPDGQLGVIPAGTRLIIDKIEFPTGWGLAQRMSQPRATVHGFTCAGRMSPNAPPG